MRLESGAYEGPFSYVSRFESGPGTNPEELIAAAHAGCFSMALSNGLAKAGFTPTRVDTTASVHLDKTDAGFGITKIELRTEAEDCELISSMATDIRKRTLFARLALDLRSMARDVESVIAARATDTK